MQNTIEMQSNKPNFIIAGAPKCGTTSMWYYLNQHPDVFLTKVKEPNYFCTDFPGVMKYHHLEDYMGLYCDSKPTHKIKGEASVSYFFSGSAAANIKQLCPDAKILIMLRNPLELLPSLHSQMYFVGDENIKDFEAAWRIGKDRSRLKPVPDCCRCDYLLDYKELGYLARHLDRYYNIWGKDKIMCVLMDDLKADAPGVVKSVCRFLEIDDLQVDTTVQNVKKKPRFHFISRFVRKKNSKTTSALVCNFKKAIGAESFNIKKTLRELNRKEVPRETISAAMRSELVEIYTEDVRKLGDMLGRDLNHWLK